MNKQYIKLCGDGTFRLTEGEWILLTVGTLTKHYAPADGVYAFRTTFNPLMFALNNKESKCTYGFFFQALCGCAWQFAKVDLAATCFQYHAGLHAGEDLAQKEVFALANRVADWAHVTGSCAQKKNQRAVSGQLFFALAYLQP